VLAEARRVLRPAGALVVGRTVAPGDGIDEQMKQRLAAILDEIGAGSHRMNVRAMRCTRLSASRAQPASRPPSGSPRERRALLERHRTGARFAALHLKSRSCPL
jgi:hypothetical protein